MHILYVDESGDDGFSAANSYPLGNTPSGFYIRTGLAIHDWKWNGIDGAVRVFRSKNHIPDSVELHSAEILRGESRVYVAAKRKYKINWFGSHFPNRADRTKLLCELCQLISSLNLTIFYMVIDKSKISKTAPTYKDMPKERSWEFLIERYNLFLNHQTDKKGIIISDAVTRNIEKEHREFARAIYTTSMHVQRFHFVESILFEPSDSSNTLQLADIAAYAAGRKYNAGDARMYDLLKQKIFAIGGSIDGFGLKVWPI